MSIKTIDINALEWFDKVNGNSYFAGEIVINYGHTVDKVNKIPGDWSLEKTFNMPFQYGHGDHYIDMANQLLEKKGSEIMFIYTLEISTPSGVKIIPICADTMEESHEKAIKLFRIDKDNIISKN